MRYASKSFHDGVLLQCHVAHNAQWYSKAFYTRHHIPWNLAAARVTFISNLHWCPFSWTHRCLAWHTTSGKEKTTNVENYLQTSPSASVSLPYAKTGVQAWHLPCRCREITAHLSLSLHSETQMRTVSFFFVRVDASAGHHATCASYITTQQFKVPLLWHQLFGKGMKITAFTTSEFNRGEHRCGCIVCVTCAVLPSGQKSGKHSYKVSYTQWSDLQWLHSVSTIEWIMLSITRSSSPFLFSAALVLRTQSHTNEI